MATKRDVSNLTIDSRVEGLQPHFEFRKLEEVSEFLLENPFLLGLLPEALTHIAQFFPSPKLSLEIFTNPETVNDQHLTIFITSTYSPPETLEKLNSLEDSWWLGASEQAQNKLAINVEF